MNPLGVPRRGPIAIAIAFALAAAMLWISEASYRHSAQALDRLQTIGAVSASVRGLQMGIVDAEAAQHLYRVQGGIEHLAAFRAARTKVENAYRALERAYAGEADPSALLRRLRRLTDQRLAMLAKEAGTPAQPGGAGAADSAAADPALRDGVLNLLDRLLELEESRLAESRADLHRSLNLRRAGVVALSVISLLALFLYLRQTFALEHERRLRSTRVRAQRDRLELEVSQRTAQLTELTHHLQTAREDERSRLARDLHDELGALLTSAKLDAARIKSRLAGGSPEALERLEHLVVTLNSVIAIKRRIGEDLRPSALSHLGLAVTLEILAREFAERSGILVHADLKPVRLNGDAELVVYRLVQEAITNLTKYAGASEVWISLEAIDHRVSVTVRDNGIGFDPQARAPSAYGLVGMRFRVEAAGGRLIVESAPGAGTTIRGELPASAGEVT